MARGRDMLVLGVSAVVVVLATAVGRSIAPSRSANPPAASAGLPPPLPSGAEIRAMVPVESGGGCSFPDRGFGDYERWRPLRVGKLLVPAGRGLDDTAGYNLLVHFHGAEPIRKQLAPEGFDLVIVAIDHGTLSSHYGDLLASPGAFRELLAAVAGEVAVASGRADAHARHLAVSSWSAGYGAVARVLAQPSDAPEAVVLLDSLHASYPEGQRRLEPGQLAPFVDFARRAAEGGPLLFVTHSDVMTQDYASTTETAAFLLASVGGERGRLFVRGYPGGGPEDHCEQLRLLPAILRDQVLPAFAPR